MTIRMNKMNFTKICACLLFLLLGMSVNAQENVICFRICCRVSLINSTCDISEAL